MRKRLEQPSYEPSPAPQLLTVLQVAQVLNVGKDTVYGLIKNEGLPAVSVGLVGTRKKLRVSVTSLDRWIKERELAQNPELAFLMNAQTDVVQPGSGNATRKGRASSVQEKLPHTGTNGPLGPRKPRY